MLIIIIIIIYLLKSTEQEDAHMINTMIKRRTRKAQKTGAYILPIKTKKTNTLDIKTTTTTHTQIYPIK